MVLKIRKNTNAEYHYTLTGFEVDISCFKSVSRDRHSSSLRFLTMYSYVVMLLLTVIIYHNQVTITYNKTQHHSHPSLTISNKTGTHTDTHPFNGPFSGVPRSAGARKVKPIWILLEQETVSGSGISLAICKSAPHSRQITTLVPHHSLFYRPDALPAAQPTTSKH